MDRSAEGRRPRSPGQSSQAAVNRPGSRPASPPCVSYRYPGSRSSSPPPPYIQPGLSTSASNAPFVPQPTTATIDSRLVTAHYADGSIHENPVYHAPVDNQHQVRVPRVKHVRITSRPPSPPPTSTRQLMVHDDQDLPSGGTTPTAYRVEEPAFPPIGPGFEGINSELDDRLSKAIGGFTVSAFGRLAPEQPQKDIIEEEDTYTRPLHKGKRTEE